MVDQRLAALCLVAIGLVACSNGDGSPTSEGLAEKLTNAHLCTSARHAGPEAFIGGGWRCSIRRPGGSLPVPNYVWGFKTVELARAGEAAFLSRACRPVDSVDAYPLVRGHRWFAVVDDAVMEKAARTLGGKVVVRRCG
jgi:hypothetical protein